LGNKGSNLGNSTPSKILGGGEWGESDSGEYAYAMDTATYRFASVIILFHYAVELRVHPIDVASFSFTYFLVLLPHLCESRCIY